MITMTPEQALRCTGRFARGARILRTLHVAPVKTSYLVERGGERFVMRVDCPLASRLGLDRAAEFEVLRHAWRAGLAPEPITLGRGVPAVLVLRYARGRAWRATDLREPANLHRLAGLLRRLHQARLPGPRLNLDAALGRYADMIGTAESRALAASAAQILRHSLGGDGAMCLCHHDPIPANVVGFRQTRLIDWEYAAIGDPLFDLAVVTRHHALPDGAVAAFAAAYFGGPGQVPWARLNAARSLYDHVLCLWLGAVGAEQELSTAQQAALRAVRRRVDGGRG
jgi:thiamine kinase